jgi:hypothetical protein
MDRKSMPSAKPLKPRSRVLSAFPGICDPAAVPHYWLELLCRMDHSEWKIVIEGEDLMFEQSPDLSPRSPWHYAYLMCCVMKLRKTIVRFETNSSDGRLFSSVYRPQFSVYALARSSKQ